MSPVCAETVQLAAAVQVLQASRVKQRWRPLCQSSEIGTELILPPQFLVVHARRQTLAKQKRREVNVLINATGSVVFKSRIMVVVTLLLDGPPCRALGVSSEKAVLQGEVRNGGSDFRTGTLQFINNSQIQIAYPVE